jgi:hypothetical protein
VPLTERLGCGLAIAKQQSVEEPKSGFLGLISMVSFSTGDRMALVRRTKSKGLRLDIIEGGQGSQEAAISDIPAHPRNYALGLPVSGAWFPGDPVGHRHFVTITDGHPFALEPGGSLSEVVQAYESWGKLNADASNAVLICHALTGDSHVVGDSNSAHPTKGWWDEVVGPGMAVDTNEFFVVCINVLGG